MASVPPNTNRRVLIGKLLVFSGGAILGVSLNRSCVHRRQALEEASARAHKHLQESARQGQAAVETRLNDLRHFFAGAKAGAPRFAEEVLGLNSKWRLVKDKALFWRNRDKHREFIEWKFGQYVLKAEDLTKTIHRCVEDFVARDSAEISNQLLTKIREDASIAIPRSLQKESRFEAATLKSIERNFVEVAQVEYKDLGIQTASFAASTVAGTIAGQVLVRVAISIATKLGVSAGVLGTGAGAAAFTFGVSLIAAIVVDLLIGWAVDFFTDPKGDITRSLTAQLSSLETLIIDGDEKTVGLRMELERIASMLDQSRREALKALLTI